ncbi:MAG: Jag N-terminal domain-containing protein [Candidatus Omnitrophica bacterium]|nr:Jag N-terminal domain-containing protein [Candidatus Omnitrophota bacterium]
MSKMKFKAKSIEAEGKTVEEAIEKALKELKLPRNRVKIESLTEEKKGLFGMAGAKPAKIRVSVIPDNGIV